MDPVGAIETFFNIIQEVLVRARVNMLFRKGLEMGGYLLLETNWEGIESENVFVW